MAGAVAIEEGVEMPGTRMGRPFVYPWGEMKVGQSFGYKGLLSSGASACSKWGGKLGKSFTARLYCGEHRGEVCGCRDREVRIWRTA